MVCEAQKKVQEALRKAISENNSEITDQDVKTACEVLLEKISRRKSKITTSVLDIKRIEGEISSSCAFRRELLIDLQIQKFLRDWRQTKQQWQKNLVQWCEDLAGGITSVEAIGPLVENCRQKYQKDYNDHIIYIHEKKISPLNDTEISMLAAYSPLLNKWRATLPDGPRRVKLSQPLFNHPNLKPVASGKVYLFMKTN